MSYAQSLLDGLYEVETKKQKEHTLETKIVNGQTIQVKVYKETRTRQRNYMKSKPTRQFKKG